MQFDTQQWITKRWETDSRFYTATVMQDLFGTWAVNRLWGSKQSKRGGHMLTPASSREEAIYMLADIDKRRQSRKYQKVEQ